MDVILGRKVVDVVSGFTGIAMARTEYLNGCVRVQVQPRVKLGANESAEWQDVQSFDIEQLKVVDPIPVELPRDRQLGAVASGGERPAMAGRAEASR